MSFVGPTDSKNREFPRRDSPGTHSRAGGNPGLFSTELAWIPAYAGMTESNRYAATIPYRHFRRRHEDHEVEGFYMNSFVCFAPSW